MVKLSPKETIPRTVRRRGFPTQVHPILGDSERILAGVSDAPSRSSRSFTMSFLGLCHNCSLAVLSSSGIALDLFSSREKHVKRM
jgi:hypothetical protein